MKNKQEAKFTTKFRKWAKKHMPTCAIEIKHARGSNIFDCGELKEHQRDSLLAAASEKHPLVYKIPDDGIAYKPFDMFVFKNAKAYVVVCYIDNFAVIPISSFPSKDKKLDARVAYFISEWYVPLKEL